MRHIKPTRVAVGILTFVIFIASSEVWALSARTQEIFSRQNRSLAPPEKSVTSRGRRTPAGERTDIEGVDPYEEPRDVGEDGSEEEPSRSPRRAERPRRQRAHGGSSQATASTGFQGERIFGIGFVGAGAYGVFGTEANIGLGHPWEIGGGLGTGMSYTTWGLHGRYYIMEDRLNPFFQFGYANWTLRRVSPSQERVHPEYLSQRFFEDRDGRITKTRTRHLIYPGIGVLYQHMSGLAFNLQLQYLINLAGTNGALYGAGGFYIYF